MSGDHTPKVLRLPETRPIRRRGTSALPYVEFAVASNFSFLRGASDPEELMVQAAHVGHAAMGLCDRNSVAGVVRAHLLKREQALPLGYHPGTRLVFSDGTPDILAYPRDRAGWGRLCRLLTCGNLRAEKGDCILHLEDLLQHADGLELIVMEDCTRERDKLNPRRVGKRREHSMPTPDAGMRAVAHADTVTALTEAAPGRVRLAASMLYRGNDRARLAARTALAREAGVPLIAVNDVLYHHPERRPLADVVTCIREHITLDQAGRRLAANAERYLKEPAEMARLFRDAPEAVAETARLSAALTFSLDELKYEYPDEVLEGFATPQEALAHLAYEGAARRYPAGLPDKVRQSLDYELRLIAELNYARYFLTVSDIVRFARSKNILCQGRGSAANSAVCFCLGVTEVDPSVNDLLFERFISSSRNEPPDIDVDFEHERREEVIQYIYRRYGRAHAGIAGTVICYRGRSAIREVGKAFGLSEDTIGALSSSIWGGGGGAVKSGDLARLGLAADSPRVAQIRALVDEIQSAPRHLSQHVGGFVITRSRLDEVMPIMNGAMDERTHVEWDKDDLDALGILKVDVLGLGMLTCIRKALDLVEAHYGVSFRSSPFPEREAHRRPSVAVPEVKDADAEHRLSREAGRGGVESPSSALTPTRQPSAVDLPLAAGGMGPLALALIPAEDPAVYRMLQRADSLGVFQVESRAQMSMLPRLKPKTFYDLVIEVAIVRPGPIQGDMVHPYLRRRQGLEPVSYPSEELQAVLQKTLGVPLFQEQAMKIAIVAAGFTPAEADKLRRAMATFKRVGTIGTFQRKMIDGMVQRSYPEEFAERCFRQIEGFGEYGFPESHAASFALLVYASSWLKCRYPDAFAAALLNAQPMGFYAPAQIVRDVREHGVEVRPVDVNFSDYDSTLEAGPRAAERLHALHRDMEQDIASTHAIRLGLREIKGLNEDDARLIVARRGTGYGTMRDLWLRTGLPARLLERLADADAFRSIGFTRRKALWAAKSLGRVGDKDDDLPLFSIPYPATPPRPPAAADPPLSGQGQIEPDVALPPMSLGEEVINDYRFLKLSLRAHPASFLREELTQRGIIRNETLRDLRNGQRVRVSGLVTIRQRPGSAAGVVFMTIEDESAIANIIVWPKLFERYRPIVLGARYVAVTGPVQQESGVIHVVTERLEDLTPLLSRLAETGLKDEALARCDEVRRPVNERRENPRGRPTPLLNLLAEMPELASDLDVPARGSAHAPSRRGGTKAG
jgi:DNA-directed DNA polymerase III PolC